MYLFPQSRSSCRFSVRLFPPLSFQLSIILQPNILYDESIQIGRVEMHATEGSHEQDLFSIPASMVRLESMIVEH